LRIPTGLHLAGHLIQKGLSRIPLNSSTEIRLTRLCTQHCRQCSVYERTTEPASMSLENFRRIARNLREYGAYIGFISGGEPTLVPHLEPILLEAKKTFRISTTLVTGLVNKTPLIQRLGRVALDQGINIQTSLDGLGALGDDLRGTPGFSKTVLKHMAWLSKNRGGSASLLYVNVVINNMNIGQVPEILTRAREMGWCTTVGLYHNLTATTRHDSELSLRPGPELDGLISFLEKDRELLNLPSWIAGIRPFIHGERTGSCAFTDAPVLATRSTIMEDGSIHLCYGEPIGNLLTEPLGSIFRGEAYKKRLIEYRGCRGCWTTCYTQRYLLVHPGNLRELGQNLKSVMRVKPRSFR
jgi:MoaA/NifB/PqqE/SkfB family radical SAM enzyme